ncbi:amidophosphoribosyltransferase [Rapidithrix thailandica]|uniref:Amidophosphoribosyltransferase n=1 Tax=Rapidithrix thailandica TaxID=413964 RepID=A0AAW9S779_9BACT
MSESIKHECGIAFIRLRKPLSYFIEKYQTPAYALNKLYLLMHKQHNRGQDGAGVASIKMNLKPGKPYLDRFRSIEPQPVTDIFQNITEKLNKVKSKHPKKFMNAEWMRNNTNFMGDVFMGHLRYGTHGKNTIGHCHPVVRPNNWRSRTLLVAGNFNMTNVEELFQKLIELGQHPKENVDTVTVMEKIGHFLDEENELLFRKYKDEGLDNVSITERIEHELDLSRVLQRACKDFDGGYAMMGMTGYGATFVARDPAGIRPAYYYANDEVIVAASEKPAIKTAFNIEYDKIQEIQPGHALIVNKKGDYEETQFTPPLPKKACSFERIYFSRGTDPEIYNERKKLGELLCPQILEAIDYDLENTVFSYIPNTAETAYLGMMSGIEKYLIQQRKKAIEDENLKGEELERILSFRARTEKIVLKDVKLRTFIADDGQRDEMVAHVYDTTYGVINKNHDTLVVLDDSIVRGTTLEKSIITLLDRLEPKRIIIVSSAPQIRFPDCYGIDMSKMQLFVAFRAMMSLLDKHNKSYLKEEVYKKAKKAVKTGENIEVNFVNELYEQFTYEEISDEIAEIVKLPHIRAEVKVIFQTVENLHAACPNHLGDWYFTGDYPTPGGTRVANNSFVNFRDGKNKRAY